MIPKGKLLIIGGHEDKGGKHGENLNIHFRKKKQTHFEILGTLIQRIPRAHHVIVVIASASSIPSEMEETYVNSYKKEGFTHVKIIKVENKADATNPESIQHIQSAHAVFFSGGDQLKLISLFIGTKMLTAIKKKYYSDVHFIVGGTSAGAMALPEIIITGGAIESNLFKGDIQLDKGFNLIQNIIVDTHFIKRGRITRLAHAVALNQKCLGIGLEENTALIISNGDQVECIGSGMVILLDGRKIRDSNINLVDNDTPITFENIGLSILAEGSFYSLLKRRGIDKKPIIS
jgi:cyanophycinase